MRTLVSLVKSDNLYFSSQSQQTYKLQHLQFQGRPGCCMASSSCHLHFQVDCRSLHRPKSDLQALPTTQFPQTVLVHKFIRTQTETDLPWSKYYLSTTPTNRDKTFPRSNGFSGTVSEASFADQSTKLDSALVHILKLLSTDFQSNQPSTTQVTPSPLSFPEFLADCWRFWRVCDCGTQSLPQLNLGFALTQLNSGKEWCR